MAEPVIPSSKLRWGTAPLVPSDLTEPDNTHKNQGWQEAEEPPHSFFNYWMNVVYLWIAYLDGLPAEAMTWTAAHIFNSTVTINDTLVVNSIMRVDDSQAEFMGPVIMDSGLSLTGGASLDSLTVSGNELVTGDLTVHGVLAGTNDTGYLHISTDVAIDGDIYPNRGLFEATVTQQIGVEAWNQHGDGAGVWGHSKGSVLATETGSAITNPEGGWNAGVIATARNVGSDGGYGSIIAGDATSAPKRAALRMTPQANLPVNSAQGDLCVLTASGQLLLADSSGGHFTAVEGHWANITVSSGTVTVNESKGISSVAVDSSDHHFLNVTLLHDMANPTAAVNVNSGILNALHSYAGQNVSSTGNRKVVVHGYNVNLVTGVSTEIDFSSGTWSLHVHVKGHG